MSYILNIETSTLKCSVSIAYKGEYVAGEQLLANEFVHGEKLHVFIRDIFEKTKIKKKDLNAVAVSKGPGSFTGLRIGVAAAKGICFAQDLPLIGINTLEIMAVPFFNKSEYNYLIPLLDARRMEVYSAIFDAKKRCIQKTNAVVLSENSFFDKVENGSCLVIGNGASKFKTLKPKINADFNVEYFPSAKDMCEVSWDLYKKKSYENLEFFEPFYLKDFQTQFIKK